MKRSVEDDITGLTQMIMFLFKRVKEATARAEALRYLFEINGVVNHEAYEATYADALADWDRAVGQAFSEALQASNAEAMMKLLQNFEGTKQ